MVSESDMARIRYGRIRQTRLRPAPASIACHRRCGACPRSRETEACVAPVPDVALAAGVAAAVAVTDTEFALCASGPRGRRGACGMRDHDRLRATGIEGTGDGGGEVHGHVLGEVCDLVCW